MIQELLNLAKKTPIDTYINACTLPYGTYLMFDNNGNLLQEQVKQNSEKAVWEQEFKIPVFFSGRINTNKSLIFKLKKIQSSNIFSFISWQDQFIDKKSLDIMTDTYLKETKKLMSDNEILLPIIEKSKQALKKAIDYVHNHVYDFFVNEDKDGNKNNGSMDKNKILIFIKTSDENYMESFDCYAKNYLFLSKDLNLEINNEIIGVPSNSCAYNSKKPFLLHYTQPNPVNYQSNFEDIYYIYLLHKWLLGKYMELKTTTLKIDPEKLVLADNLNEYYLVEGFIKSDKQSTEYIVTNFQFISETSDILDIESENFLEIDLKNSQLPDIITWKDLAIFINKDLFSFKLYDKDVSINDDISSNLINIFNKYRDRYIEAIKYKDISIIQNIIGISISEVLLEQCKIALKAVNDDKSHGLYISIIKKLLLMKYNILCSQKITNQGGSQMKTALIEVQNSVFEKIDGLQEPICQSTDEYCFAAGQLARYLINQSAASNVTFKEVSPLLNSQKCSMLKNNLNNLERKYAYALRIHFSRLNNLFKLVHSTEFEDKDMVNRDMFLAGFVTENRLYVKNDENNRIDKEEETNNEEN